MSAEKYIITRTFTDGHGRHGELELEEFEYIVIYSEVIKRRGQYQWGAAPSVVLQLFGPHAPLSLIFPHKNTAYMNILLS